MDNREEETVLQVLPPLEPGAISQITRAEVDMQVSTAKAYPRSIARAKSDMKDLACISKEVAESCFYAIPRAKKLIEGPSVRLAEIALTSWGNTRTEAKIIEVGKQEVTAQATTWDMEKNVLVRIEARRRITDRQGNRFNNDMILVTGNAAISIALRNSIFRVIPRAIIDEVYRQARQVAFGNAKAIEQSRATMFETFGKLGVDEARLLASLAVESVEEVGATELSKLRGVFNAIRDREISIETAFPPVPTDPAGQPAGPETASRTASVMERMQGRAAPGATPKDPAASTEAPAPQGQQKPMAKKERLDQIEQQALAAGVGSEEIDHWKKEINIRDGEARSQTNKRLDALQARVEAWTKQHQPVDPGVDKDPAAAPPPKQIVVTVSQKIVDNLLDRIRGLIGWEGDEARQWVERVLDEPVPAITTITVQQAQRLEGILDQREGSLAE